MAKIFESVKMDQKFKELIEEIIPSLNKCGNCSISYCNCLYFTPMCGGCRLVTCENCRLYSQTIELLLQNCSNSIHLSTSRRS